jgi:small multidrug resistance pump
MLTRACGRSRNAAEKSILRLASICDDYERLPAPRRLPERSTLPSKVPMSWLYLLIAIACEVTATSALKASANFTNPLPSAIVVAGYGVSFYCLSLALRTIPVGVAYAVWSGVGVALVCVAGWLIYGQKLDAAAFIGIGLILCGAIVLNLFSSTAA